jgi:sn-glycerol 3-phosphate transport system permease protein
MVDHIFVLTRGGPDNASTLLLYHLYEVGFKFWDTAYASAITVVLVAVLTSVALVQFFLLDKRTHYK